MRFLATRPFNANGRVNARQWKITTRGKLGVSFESTVGGAKKSLLLTGWREVSLSGSVQNAVASIVATAAFSTLLM